jgi:hypothetical protein
MKKITLLLLTFITPLVFSQSIVSPIYDGVFAGTTYSQTFNFPTGAGIENYAGFANNNVSIYPLSYPNGGKVSFKATVATNAEIKFVFEADLYPNVTPSVSTVNVNLLASNPANTLYEVAIPASATNTYKSALMYVVTRNVAVSLSEIKLIKFDTNGTTQLKVDFPVYDGTFAGTTYSQTFNFPTGAGIENYAGFANNNLAIYPLSFASGINKVSFKATVATNAEIKFVFEKDLYPNVTPSVSTANVALLASNPANTLYEVVIPVSATNTYKSALMYIITRDVAVTLSEIKIQLNAAAPPAGPTTAAPTPPARLDADVISLFSDAYTNIAVANWNQAPIWYAPTGKPVLDVMVASNPTKKIEFASDGFIGVVLNTYNNATDMTHFHMDYWIQTGTDLTGKVLNPKWSNHALQAGETNALLLTNLPTTAGSWVSLDVPLSSFTPQGGGTAFAREALKEFTITSNLGDVYIDNIYLHKNTVLSTDSFAVSKVSLYPNPASNVLNIESVGTIQNIAIYNVLGQEVMNKLSNETSVSLDVSGLNSGIYVIKTKIDGTVSSSKFIKE